MNTDLRDLFGQILTDFYNHFFLFVCLGVRGGHELLCNLDDVVKAAADSLKVHGRFFMVHRPKRLVQIFDSMTSHGLEPKRIRMVHPYDDKAANMVLIEAVKGGKPQLDVEPPLIVYNHDGSYTQELLKMYGDNADE